MQCGQSKNYRRIIVEGNIGAGKSTFLRLLQETFFANFIVEPHEEWQNVGGHNLLDKFYHDKMRWAYTFQSYAFITRMRADEHGIKNSTHDTHILERSVYSDRYCFAKNCFEMGVISELEWKLYQEWFTWLIESQHYRPDGFIYLQTDPSICYQRMITRNRSEESTISIEYLNMIHQKHEDWLIKKEGVPSYLKDVPVLILECNEDFEHSAEEQEKHFSAIQSFFNIPLLVDKKNEKSYVTSL
jgi:deoxyadenosine/deoxycytidine kinase